jgi:hypothetical protein
MPGPSGTRLTDGFPTLYSFANAPTIEFWEAQTKPPGFDTGGPNDATTMRAVAWRQNFAKKLKTLTPATLTCQYDPKVLNSILANLGVNQLVTTTFPNTHTWSYWAYIDKFEPNEMREGEPPTAAVTIQPTNLDNTQTEVAPTYT